ncbi:ABC transporter ATP-binding protein [Natrialba asiatica]|uniref:Sulfate-transporting ATPase n=1 Tax=Natrialba asiatica (strain ATCC 700177 / DSM 12278 / JCM 9576 / FERM P-10747 / NBRC 102637 / 172P1) TaxID=29540 RepID=M0AM63_NATA1|nr:ABC transporter ATP-binding protein [Natrialba asiatica]ELY99436.1 sulfate-transporting ATPase [Natrialba asiatica DSM 12278]
MAVIEANALSKRYGESTVLDSIDLQVEEGEIFGFLGPNGAGKSTFIDILLDFRRPTSGQLSVLGHDSQRESKIVRQRSGILPDGYELYSRLPGRQHIEFAATVAGVDSRPDRVLARVGLEGDGDQPVGSYSKGMCQRLALGMVLASDPDLLILDEPASGLDPNGIQQLQEIVREEADRGTTVFFSSHLLEQVEAVCDRVGILNDGELLAVDAIDALQEAIGGSSELLLTVDDQPIESSLRSLEELDGITDVDADGTTIRLSCSDPAVKSKAITQTSSAGLTVTDVDVQRRSLEELFSEYTEAGDR